MTTIGRNIIDCADYQRSWRVVWLGLAWLLGGSWAESYAQPQDDYWYRLQTQAIEQNRADFGYWGPESENYTGWGSHSNRLIPVYTFGTKGAGAGVDLTSYTGPHSPYRDADQVRKLYGYIPNGTVHDDADYMDQTNLFQLQRAAALAGKKYIFLVIFDGMDWQTTWAASIVKQGRVSYREGRGRGLHFQDYPASGTAQFAWMCTSPHNEGSRVDVNQQTVLNPGGELRGGYDPLWGGFYPWSLPLDPGYPIAKASHPQARHAYTDSSSSATSMTAGIKTANDMVNVDPTGQQVETIAHILQREGWGVGVVSSVPISHATPACAYAHNVSRDDFQDLTRDLLGLPSISHPHQPLPGLDVVIGGGFGETKQQDKTQGDNFVAGNVYLTDADRQQVDVRHGGKYVTAVRTAGQAGREVLLHAAQQAKQQRHRLLGFFGLGAYKGHLPYRTANGDYRPPIGRAKKAEQYSAADLLENPTLAEMTQAALIALEQHPRFWLMVEPGDVDWANHDNNIDNAIGAVLSGEEAVKVITDWVEQHSNWEEALLIVTADHGHYLNLVHPERLLPPASSPSVP